MFSYSTERFTPTMWGTPDEKSDLATRFVRFVESGFAVELFTASLYRGLAQMFGFIAEGSIDGFFATHFATPEARVRFVRQCVNHDVYSDPLYTYSDVERALSDWLIETGVLGRVKREAAVALELRERAELERCAARYDRNDGVEVTG